MNSADIVLSVRNLEVEYQARRGRVKAVNDVSFDLRRGESITLVGESGCGKTTLGLSLVRLLPKQATIRDGLSGRAGVPRCGAAVGHQLGRDDSAGFYTRRDLRQG